ncbi:metal ABC transporter permease [bacterium]|nr:metal ABC transporter permease [bacterium]
MIELFSMQFFRNAFIMSCLLSVLFGFFSFFIVMRRMSFLGAGIAHTAFGGVALGILLGIDPFYSSLVFCVVSAILIGRLTQAGHVSYDTGIGIFFSFSMALGALFIALRKAYTFDLSGYLFGNILGVTNFDQVLVFITVLICVPIMLGYLHKILFLTFDEKVAAVSGVPIQMLDTLLLIFLAIIIVISIKIVGIILVSALIVLPASFGLLLSKDYRTVMKSAIGYSLAIMLGGLALSYYLNLPTGATIVILGTIVYFITLIVSKIKSR